MIIMCGWCQKLMSTHAPYNYPGIDWVSHSICCRCNLKISPVSEWLSILWDYTGGKLYQWLLK